MSVNYISKLIYGFKISFEDSETLSKEVKEKYICYPNSKKGNVFFGISIDRNSLDSIPVASDVFPKEVRKEVDNAFKKYFPEKEHAFSAVYLCLGVC